MKKIHITKPENSELKTKGIFTWPIWSCEISEFPWTYDQKESCFILEGEMDVITEDETVKIMPGDFVVFPAGLSCTWKVTKPVRKHYSFG